MPSASAARLSATVPIGASSHGQEWPLNDDTGNERKDSNQMTLLVISIEKRSLVIKSGRMARTVAAHALDLR